MVTVEDIFHEIRWHFVDGAAYLFAGKSGRSALEHDLAQAVLKALPDETKLGREIVANGNKIIKKIKTLQEELISNLSDFESDIEDAWDRVIETAKEDIDEEEPETVDDEDIYDVYRPEDIWKWWTEEWRHNLDELAFSKYISERDFSFKDFMRHERHIPSVFIPILDRIEKTILRATNEAIEGIQNAQQALQNNLFNLFESMFADKDFDLRR